MSMVLLRLDKDNQYKHGQSQANSSDNENKMREDRVWEMIKEKCEYDNLEPERKRIVEQLFYEMVYKRKMRNVDIDDITEKTLH